jgi:hypothetical protein
MLVVVSSSYNEIKFFVIDFCIARTVLSINVFIFLSHEAPQAGINTLLVAGLYDVVGY